MPKPSSAAVAKTATSYETIAEAASRLGVHRDTIRRRIAAGRLTAYRDGARIIRLDRSEVDGILRPIPTAAAREAA